MNDVDVVKSYWRIIHDARFIELQDVMHDEVEVLLANTNEKIIGLSKFTAFNREYPGRWRIRLNKIHSADDIVISVANVYNGEVSHNCVAFSTIIGCKIIKHEEYWGEVTPIPVWRDKLDLSEKVNLWL